ncbi:YitT family protein [Bacillus massilinigeriensis]|uniref:YitT family protein n=1 Tax=Bacillus massilionigeriensis TaxID=1805475 RepID=UPI00096B6316|nr:YitT family protein [Bacillus massilionigeriensis]
MIIIKNAAILIGSFLIGIGINGFLVPHHLLDGGMVGIALIIHYYFHCQTGLTMFVISIPLIIYAWFQERGYFFSSFQGLIVSSFFIDWLAPLQTQFHLPILISTLLGGTIIGIGVGLMLRYETSTGGTDLLASIISKATSIHIGVLIFLIDGLIALLGLQVLGVKSFLFSALCIITVGSMTSLFVGNEFRNGKYCWRVSPFLRR